MSFVNKFKGIDPMDLEKKQLDLHLKRIELIQRLRSEERSIASLDEQRLFPFSFEVNTPNVRLASEWLSQAASRSTEPITLEFMSPGGSVLPGLALYDAIQRVRARGIHVTTVSIGYTASMAGVLVQAGDKRVITRNSYFHIHEVSSGALGNVSEMEDATKFAKTLWEQLSQILSERATLWTPEALRDRVRRQDWWLRAEEALSEGFVDEVV